MLNTDTLNFEGDAGSLFSIADDLTGSVFTVGDISGLPIIDVNGDTHNVTLNQFDGKTMIGGTDSGSVDSDILNVVGNIRTTGIVSSTDSGTFGGNGTTSGITLTDGLIDMRTATGNVSKIRFYCETNNLHHQTLQAQPHSAGSSAVITLPASTGTLLTDGSTITATNITASENNSNNETVYLTFVDGATGTQGIETDTGLYYNPYTGQLNAANFQGSGALIGQLNGSLITSGTIDSARLPSNVSYSSGGSGITVQDEGSSLSSLGTTLNFVGSGVVASGTGSTKTITISGGGGGGGGGLDSSLTTQLIDSSYVQARQAAGAGFTVQDEGSSLSTLATTVNFVGSGVTASGTGSTKTITISGGGGGGSGITAGASIVRSFLFG